MSANVIDTPIEQWLQALARALESLPAEDSREIVAEAREHLHELLVKGDSPEEALTGFGSAEAYARCFMDEHLLTEARASGRTVPMLRTVVRFARRSFVAVVGLACATVLAFFGAWSLVCMGIKVVEPELVGLWLDLPLSVPHRYVHSQRDFIPLHFGHDHIVLGFQNPPPQFPEYLGPWIYACLAVIAVLSYFALRGVLRATVKRIRLPERK